MYIAWCVINNSARDTGMEEEIDVGRTLFVVAHITIEIVVEVVMLTNLTSCCTKLIILTWYNKNAMGFGQAEDRTHPDFLNSDIALSCNGCRKVYKF